MPRVEIDNRGIVSAVNALVVQYRDDVSRMIGQDLARRRFDLVISKARTPLMKREGVNNLLSITNLRTALSILQSIDTVNSTLSDVIENCKQLISLAVAEKQRYLDINPSGNIAYID